MDIKETNRRWQTALADRDLTAMERLLWHGAISARVLWRDDWQESSHLCELRGLLLLDGDHDVPFVEDCPWGIPPGVGLGAALEHLWAPVSGRCPRLFEALRTHVFALALVAIEGEYRLAYMYFDDSTELPRATVDLPWGSARLHMLWGLPPTSLDPADVHPVLGEPLPAPVHDLAAVHAGLISFDIDLRLDRFTNDFGASILDDYDGEDPADYAEREDFVRALNGEFDHHMRFCVCESACAVYFLDLADRELDGNPRVAMSCMDATSERPGGAFWSWVDEALPALLFDE